MHPGISPIYIDPDNNQTNRPPAGDDPGWDLVSNPTKKKAEVKKEEPKKEVPVKK